MVRVGIIGVGYWGPNLVRCFQELPECQVAYICDRNTKSCDEICHRFPDVIGTTDAADLLRRDRVDAAVIATPIKTHYPLAMRALDAGLHTFIEKPLATNGDQCVDLIELAEDVGRVLFVGHVFLYSAAVAKLKEIVASGELGDIYYISSNRLNLGLGAARCQCIMGPGATRLVHHLGINGLLADQRELLRPGISRSGHS